MYNSLIAPHFDYCASIVFLANKTQQKPMQILQNRDIMRLILRCDRLISRHLRIRYCYVRKHTHKTYYCIKDSICSTNYQTQRKLPAISTTSKISANSLFYEDQWNEMTHNQPYQIYRKSVFYRLFKLGN